jgi:hypothetical protein
MSHTFVRVTSFTYLGDYRLGLRFDDGQWSEVDLAPVLHGSLYGPLLDKTLFNQATIDPDVGTLVWPNGADFDPDTLRNWSSYLPSLAGRAALETWQFNENSEPPRA